jgi:L-ascorbate metabolism protein UlaG (beta-lactamase superfamily)
MVKNMVFTIKWLGHASFQIIVNGFNIYVDPYEGTYVDKADLILLSHEHFDHCDISKIEKIRKEETIIIAPSTCLSRIKGKVKVLKAGEKVTINDFIIEAVQAYNIKRFRSPGVPFHPKGSGLGYLITASGKTIYYAGDTDFVQEMNKLKNVFLAILPTGGTYTMDNPEAAEATLTIKPQVVIPMHTLDSDPKQFKMLVEQSSKIKVTLLNHSEKYEFE